MAAKGINVDIIRRGKNGDDFKFQRMYVYDASKFLVVVDISNLTYVIFQTYVYFYDAVFMIR